MVREPGDAVITSDGRLIMVRDFGAGAGHPDVYESEGTNTRDYIRDGLIRIGGDFPGGKTSYMFFEGSIEALSRHGHLIQEIAGEWAQENAIIELSNGKESTEVSMDDVFYTEDVGDLTSREFYREQMLAQSRLSVPAPALIEGRMPSGRPIRFGDRRPRVAVLRYRRRR